MPEEMYLKHHNRNYIRLFSYFDAFSSNPKYPNDMYKYIYFMQQIHFHSNSLLQALHVISSL